MQFVSKPLLTFLGGALIRLSNVAAGRACYYPDGSTTPWDVPCNPDDEQSYCCFPGMLCTSNKMCMNFISPPLLNRGSCTDSTWQDQACPSFCRSVKPDAGVALVSCNTTGQYVCGENSTSCSDGDKIVGLGVPIPTATAGGSAIIWPMTSLATSVVTVVVTASLPLATAPTDQTAQSQQSGSYSDMNGLTTGEKIGLGIGIPAAVVGGMALAAFATWKTIRNVRNKQSVGEANLSSIGRRMQEEPLQLDSWSRLEAPMSPQKAELGARSRIEMSS